MASNAPRIDELVTRQFGPQAQAYVSSVVHARGEDLDALAAMLRAAPAARLLDLGCGGGHVSFTAAPFARRVTAYDLSAQMLAVVRAEAAQRGLEGIETVEGPAENLPFADATFDMVASRYSAHHWRDLGAGLKEARRVLKPGGRAIFMDVVAAEHPLLDTYLQTVETLRDPSHVRDYSLSQWQAAARTAGFAVEDVQPRRLRLEFEPWVTRIATPAAHLPALRSLAKMAAAEVQAHFDIEPDGTFTLDTASLLLRPV